MTVFIGVCDGSLRFVCTPTGQEWLVVLGAVGGQTVRYQNQTRIVRPLRTKLSVRETDAGIKSLRGELQLTPQSAILEQQGASLHIDLYTADLDALALDDDIVFLARGEGGVVDDC